tara:strand:- start:1101 stop:1331 length:231 start_codon:yes stop_codon:yes gene_type:complete
MSRHKLEDYIITEANARYLLIIDGKIPEGEFQTKVHISEEMYKHGDKILDGIINNYVNENFSGYKYFSYKIKDINE